MVITLLAQHGKLDEYQNSRHELPQVRQARLMVCTFSGWVARTGFRMSSLACPERTNSISWGSRGPSWEGEVGMDELDRDTASSVLYRRR